MGFSTSGVTAATTRVDVARQGARDEFGAIEVEAEYGLILSEGTDVFVAEGDARSLHLLAGTIDCRVAEATQLDVRRAFVVSTVQLSNTELDLLLPANPNGDEEYGRLQRIGPMQVLSIVAMGTAKATIEIVTKEEDRSWRASAPTLGRFYDFAVEHGFQMILLDPEASELPL